MKFSCALLGILITLHIVIISVAQNNVGELSNTETVNGTTPDNFTNIDVANNASETYITEEATSGTTPDFPDFANIDFLSDALGIPVTEESGNDVTASDIPEFVKNGDIAAILHSHKHGDIDLPVIPTPDRQNPEYLQSVKNGDMPPFSEFVKGNKTTSEQGNHPQIPDFVKDGNFKMPTLMEGEKVPDIPEFIKEGNNPSIPDFVKQGNNIEIPPEYTMQGNAPAIPEFIKGGNMPAIPDFVLEQLMSGGGQMPAIPQSYIESGTLPPIPQSFKDGNVPDIPEHVKNSFNISDSESMAKLFNSSFSNLTIPKVTIPEVTIPEVTIPDSSAVPTLVVEEDSSEIIGDDFTIPESFRQSYERRLEKEAREREEEANRPKTTPPPPVADPVIIPEFMKPFLDNADHSNPQIARTLF